LKEGKSIKTGATRADSFWNSQAPLTNSWLLDTSWWKKPYQLPKSSWWQNPILELLALSIRFPCQDVAGTFFLPGLTQTNRSSVKLDPFPFCSHARILPFNITHLSALSLSLFSRVGFEPTPLAFSELPFIRLVTLVTRFALQQTTSGGLPDHNPNPSLNY
jgi:hypothetical protein